MHAFWEEILFPKHFFYFYFCIFFRVFVFFFELQVKDVGDGGLRVRGGQGSEVKGKRRMKNNFFFI